MWVAATKGIRLPTPPTPEELDRRVREVRALLREGNAEAIDIDADDEGLAVLSRLCFELSNESDESHELLFREASLAYAIVSRIPWPSEEFGERDEILSDLALAAWRGARQVHSARVAQEWERRHQDAVSKSAALRACLEHYITTNASDRTDELRQSFFSDARTLLAMVALLRLRRNATPHVVAELGSELFDWVQSSGVQGCKKELIYLLADLSVLVGGCCRFIGDWHAAKAWLSRAEGLFQKTARPEAGLARVAYARLALLATHIDMRRFFGGSRIYIRSLSLWEWRRRRRSAVLYRGRRWRPWADWAKQPRYFRHCAPPFWSSLIIGFLDIRRRSSLTY